MTESSFTPNDPSPTTDWHMLHETFNEVPYCIQVYKAIRNADWVVVDFELLLSNVSAKEFLGRLSMAAQHVMQLFPEEKRNHFFRQYAHVVETEETCSNEIYLDLNGKKIKLFIDCSKYNDGIMLTFSENSRNKNMTTSAAQVSEQEKAHYLMNMMRESCYELDMEGRFIYLNRSAEELFGMSREDVIGKNVWEVFPSAVNTPGYTAVTSALIDRIPSRQEYVSVFLNSWVCLSATPTENGIVVVFHEVNDLAQICSRQQREHRRLKRAEAIAHVGSFEWMPSENKVYFSDELYRILGLDFKDDVLDFEESMSYIHPDDKAIYLHTMKHCLRERAPFTLRYRALCGKTGVEHTLLLKGEFLAGKNNADHLVYGIIQDITEAERLRGQLQEQEAQMTALVSNIPDIITRWDADARLLYANPAFHGRLGIPDTNSVYGKNKTEIGMDPELALPWIEKVKLVAQTGVPLTHYPKMNTLQGETYLFTRMVPEKIADGSIRSVLTISRDITELIKIELQLQEKNNLLQGVLNAPNNRVIVFDAVRNERHEIIDFRYKLVSQATINFYGKDYTGLLFSEAFPNSFNAQFDELKKVVQNGTVRTWQDSHEINGNTLWSLVTDSKLGDGIVRVRMDITELNKMEEAKRKAEHERQVAMNALKFKQQFLSNMSHEIRTPLTAIIGFTDEMLKSDLDAQQSEYISAIKVSSDALLSIVNDILDLAKVDAGKMTFNEKAFHLDACVRNMLLLFETKVQQKNLSLVKKYASDIPPMLIGDSLRLNQILLNLIGNAVKFTTEGEICVNVKLVSEDEQKALIEISVSDTGIGIEPENLENIFDTFQQANPRTTQLYGGTGLGLSIVKQLVEAQGGTITVTSREGEGSTFSVTLPFRKPENSYKKLLPKIGVEIPKPVEIVPVKNEDIRILVAEDIELNQALMTVILKNMGFKADIVSNGKLAVEMLQKNRYDIVLMDLHMPVMNGFEATQYIRKQLGHDIPIIALTADVTTTDIEKIRAENMNDYTTKPINLETLYSKIMKLVGKKDGGMES